MTVPIDQFADLSLTRSASEPGLASSPASFIYFPESLNIDLANSVATFLPDGRVSLALPDGSPIGEFWLQYVEQPPQPPTVMVSDESTSPTGIDIPSQRNSHTEFTNLRASPESYVATSPNLSNNSLQISGHPSRSYSNPDIHDYSYSLHSPGSDLWKRQSTATLDSVESYAPLTSKRSIRSNDTSPDKPRKQVTFSENLIEEYCNEEWVERAKEYRRRKKTLGKNKKSSISQLLFRKVHLSGNPIINTVSPVANELEIATGDEIKKRKDDNELSSKLLTETLPGAAEENSYEISGDESKERATPTISETSFENRETSYTIVSETSTTACFPTATCLPNNTNGLSWKKTARSVKSLLSLRLGSSQPVSATSDGRSHTELPRTHLQVLQS